MHPVPSQPTPILIGGHSEAALKRAARNDGWMCAGATVDELRDYISQLNAWREQYGTADKPWRVFTTGQHAMTRAGIEELEAIGVTDVVIGFRDVYNRQPDADLDTKIQQLNWYAGEFIQS